MNFFGSLYVYDTSSLLALQKDDIIYIGIITIIGIFIYFLLPSLQKMIDKKKKQKNKTDKKKIIEDLIMMKEIQNEIEQEMREALIREELRSKKGEELVN